MLARSFNSNKFVELNDFNLMDFDIIDNRLISRAVPRQWQGVVSATASFPWDNIFVTYSAFQTVLSRAPAGRCKVVHLHPLDFAFQFFADHYLCTLLHRV